jgi:hypothetical protein
LPDQLCLGCLDAARVISIGAVMCMLAKMLAYHVQYTVSRSVFARIATFVAVSMAPWAAGQVCLGTAHA